jgi:hypothetical protein
MGSSCACWLRLRHRPGSWAYASRSRGRGSPLRCAHQRMADQQEIGACRTRLHVHARAAAIAAVCSALGPIRTPAGAQQEHHAVPAGSAPVALTGTASCAQGTPSSGAVVQLFHGDGPGRPLMTTTVADAAGRFAVRTGAGTYTLEIGRSGQASHRQQTPRAAIASTSGSPPQASRRRVAGVRRGRCCRCSRPTQWVARRVKRHQCGRSVPPGSSDAVT